MITFIKNLLNERKIRKHIKQSRYVDTLYSANWMVSNHDRLIDCLPDTLTHIDNIDMVRFGFKMKLMDVPWEDYDQLKEILFFFEQLGMLIRKNEYQFVRNENTPIGDRARELIDSQ